jgi:hypothetical protein
LFGLAVGTASFFWVEEAFPGRLVVASAPVVDSKVNRGPVYVGSFESSPPTLSFVVGIGALEESASVRDAGVEGLGAEALEEGV